MNLRVLSLESNQLQSLPPEIGGLTKLTSLNLWGNQLQSLPPEIVAQGSDAVLTYLRGLLRSRGRLWESKLVLVGEGMVGKTSLLRSLLGEPFQRGEGTTRGIAIRKLPLYHPTEPGITMTLHTWDFGGQEIYHDTHRFFLTDRALFVLVWNARAGHRVGRLEYWLDAIHARAPESPVLLVATHAEDYAPDLDLAALMWRYPQIRGQWVVSNERGTGIDEFKQVMTRVAAQLPRMGQPWPGQWLDAMTAIREIPERVVLPSQLDRTMASRGLDREEQATLARALHDLGHIFYDRDDPELNGLAILQPQWVAQEIARALTDPVIKERGGVFTRGDRDRNWADHDPAVRDQLLKLMERFDLSYPILDERGAGLDQGLSLIVKLLPEAPPEYQSKWDEIQARPGSRELSMRFEFATLIPAGIPTWFIAREHRFTTGLHWRRGALLADPHRDHYGLVEAPDDRTVRLAVRGLFPHYFFSVLLGGLEATLERYPGLSIRRKIPCPGRDGQPCTHEFDLDFLTDRLKQTPPRLTIECAECYAELSVSMLLRDLGQRIEVEGPVGYMKALLQKLEEQTRLIKQLKKDQSQGFEQVQAGQGPLECMIRELTAMVQREFLRALRRDQAKPDSHCPPVFSLRPEDGRSWVGKLLCGEQLTLRLYCNAPGQWHPTLQGGTYPITITPEWLKGMAPYIRRLVAVMKYVTPLIGPVLGKALPDFSSEVKNDIELMNALVTKLPEIGIDDPEAPMLASAMGQSPRLATGAELRLLRHLLDEHTDDNWGGLSKIYTKEDDYLWLCEHHADALRAPSPLKPMS
jgi:hypothetical protein